MSATQVSSSEAEGVAMPDLGDENDDSTSVRFILGESGYMKSVLHTLALLHTLISFCSIIGYYCLKARFAAPHLCRKYSDYTFIFLAALMS